ncbi:MAG TPA: PRC-barrel domain-containing protein [Telluria sp.]|nr:PRC-barrel domain-containing protein [Telluria sp.]
MNTKTVIAVAIVTATLGAGAQTPAPPAPVAGKATLGVALVEMDALVAGWSVKRDLMGKAVVNDQKDRIGKIDDIIFTPANEASFAIVGVGGFLGLGKNDVAIPMRQLKIQNGQLLLPGSTKDALKTLPKFEYAPRK